MVLEVVPHDWTNPFGHCARLTKPYRTSAAAEERSDEGRMGNPRNLWIDVGKNNPMTLRYSECGYKSPVLVRSSSTTVRRICYTQVRQRVVYVLYDPDLDCTHARQPLCGETSQSARTGWSVSALLTQMGTQDRYNSTTNVPETLLKI